MGPQIGILAEIASLQLEYTYLAKLTGKKEHFTRVRYLIVNNISYLIFMKANNVIKTLAAANLSFTGGMSPVLWNISSGKPHDCTCHMIRDNGNRWSNTSLQITFR